MLRYLTRRFIFILVSLYIIATVTFFLMRAAPGGPFTSEKKLPPEILQQLNEAYGLNNPWYVQYWDYIKNIAMWNFGTSFKFSGQSVNDIIDRSFPVSFALGVEAILLAVCFGIILGVIAAIRHNKWPDYIAMIIAVLGISVPSFILATVLQYVFSMKLGWLPVARFENFQSTILPSLALAATPLAFIARLTRSSMLEVMNQDYIKTAKAKGLKKSIVVFKHGIRNALLPVISYLGPLTAGIVTGSFIIEQIFGIPGLGNEFVNSITDRDYTTIMGVTVFYSILLLISILIVDIVYGFIDPRIKINSGKGK